MDDPNLLGILAGMTRDLQRLYDELSDDFILDLWNKGVYPTDTDKVVRSNKIIAQKMQKHVNRLRRDLNKLLQSKVRKGWELSNRRQDVLVNTFMKGVKVPPELKAGLFDRSEDALERLITRQRNGMNLSQRVWNLSQQAKTQMELYLRDAVEYGVPANKAATELKQFLKNPDKQFRRVRNSDGKLVLSRPARNYHPGRGVYRSSYRNALRLARTEVNIAYRSADVERRKQLWFVKGIEVKLSAAHPQYDICDEMIGVYPPDFDFTGWHPNCLCYTTTILPTETEFKEYLKGNAERKVDKVRSIPKRAKRYIQINADRIKNAQSTPYWFRDNFTRVGNTITSKFSLEKPIEISLLPVQPIPQIVRAVGTSGRTVPVTKPIVQKGQKVIQIMEGEGYPVLKADEIRKVKNFDDYIKMTESIKSKEKWGYTTYLDPDEAYDFLKDLGDFNPEHYVEDIIKVLEKKGLQIGSSNISIGSNAVKTRIGFTSLSGEAGEISRTFRVVRDYKRWTSAEDFTIQKKWIQVSHDYFRLPSDVRGGGIGKELFQQFYKHYKAIGVDELFVHANIDVGGWAWGRYGFSMMGDQYDLEKFIKAIARRNRNVHNINEITDELFDIMETWHDNNNPWDFRFPMHLFTDNPRYRQYFLNSDWEGNLFLKDVNEEKRLLDYIYGRNP